MTMKKCMPWFIVAIATGFYCFAYFLRVSPSVMKADLMQHFHLSATAFGTLAAFYYYAYVPMQLPVGMIIDRFGARQVLFLMCLACVSGVTLFLNAEHYLTAALGRFLIGFGAAFAYITVLKLGTLWLPPNRFSMLAGATSSFGMLAGMFCNQYLPRAILKHGYQQAMWPAIMVGLLLAVTILLFVRNRPSEPLPGVIPPSKGLSLRELGSALVTMFKNRQLWLIGIIGLLLYLPSSMLLDLWGTPYFMTVYGLNQAQTANACCMVFVGWIIASPLLGAFSDHIGTRKIPLVVTSLIAFVLVMIIFYGPHLSLYTLYPALFIFGLCCGSHPLCFSMSKETSPASVSGMVTAYTNMLIMLGGIIFQPLFGRLMDWHNGGIIEDGLRVYNASDYTFAMGVLPIALLLSAVLGMFVHESKKVSQSVEDEPVKQGSRLQEQMA